MKAMRLATSLVLGCVVAQAAGGGQPPGRDEDAREFDWELADLDSMKLRALSALARKERISASMIEECMASTRPAPKGALIRELTGVRNKHTPGGTVLPGETVCNEQGFCHIVEHGEQANEEDRARAVKLLAKQEAEQQEQEAYAKATEASVCNMRSDDVEKGVLFVNDTRAGALFVDEGAWNKAKNERTAMPSVPGACTPTLYARAQVSCSTPP